MHTISRLNLEQEIGLKWVMNYEKRITKTIKDMIRSNLCDYINAYVIVSGTITITVSGDHDAAKWADGRNKGVIFKNCVVFTDCISNINNTQMDNPKDIDFLIPLYDLIEYSDNYSKSAGSLWRYYIDEPSDQ